MIFVFNIAHERIYIYTTILMRIYRIDAKYNNLILEWNGHFS